MHDNGNNYIIMQQPATWERSIEWIVFFILIVFTFFISRKFNNINKSIVLSKWIEELFQNYKH